MQRFNSVVNTVELVTSESGSFVRKQYKDTAIATGIKVPIKRVEIEINVLDFLKNQKSSISNFISVPRILNVDLSMPFIEIEYINGETLFEILEGGNTLKCNFFEVGQWLHHFENQLFNNYQNLFEGLSSTQNEIASILESYKGCFKDKNEKHSVSLGDVGFKNLIWASSRLWAIDFDFAHVAVAGRDVGQLLAQLETRNMDKKLSQDLINGYLKDGGCLNLIESWKDIFSKYYQKQ